MTIRTHLYNTISQALATTNAFNWIDLYKGQMTNTNDSYPTGFPAAFISVGRITYQDMTFNIQEGEVNIDVYLFFNKGGDTFVDAEDQATSLQILNLLDTTVNTLQWLKTNWFTALSQTAEDDLTERYQRPAYKLSFTAQVYNRLNINNYVLN